MRKHIALLGKTFCFSGGGIFFISLITKALSVNSNNVHRITLLLPNHLKLTPLRITRQLLGKIKRACLKSIGVSTKSYIPGRTLIHALKKINGTINVVFYDDTDHGLTTCLQKTNSDVVLPVMGPLEKNTPFAWVGGTYDFQYKYYPEFFPQNNFKQRDESIKKMLTNAKAILVNSTNTKNDLDKYFPGHTCKIFCMPFAANPEIHWFNNSYSKVKNKYALPEKYFLISNQLWIHKSHTTAFQALQTLHTHEKYRNIHIVCTGITNDSRFPNYFNELKEKIKTLNVENHIHFLGHIPSHDQIQIMRHAQAVLQPTLFEGGPGGGSSYQAVATDTPLIVSDIPVNLELNNEQADVTFFNALSSDDLAKKMLFVLKRKNREQKTPKTLIAEGQRRLESLGNVLLEAINHASEEKTQ